MKKTITTVYLICAGIFIVGIILACIGIACILLSKRVTMIVDKTDAVQKTSKVYVGVRVAGVIAILLGMILIALP